MKITSGDLLFLSLAILALREYYFFLKEEWSAKKQQRNQ
jgi:hypothetical protein